MTGITEIIESFSENEHELAHLPDNVNKSFIEMLAIWGGATFSTSAFVIGGALAPQVSFSRFLIAFFSGLVLAAIIAILMGIIAMEVGLTFHTASRYFFGTKGSYLPSGIQVVVRTGYGAVNLAFAALFVQAAFNVPFVPSVLILGGFFLATAFIGIDALKVISYITIPLVTIVFVYGLLEMGIDSVNILNVGSSQNQLSVTAIISTGMAAWIAGAIVSPDWLRYSRTKATVVSTTFIAVSIFALFLTSLAFLSLAVAGAADLPQAMLDAGLIIPAAIGLILLTWSTVDNWYYSASLGISNILNINKIISVAVIGIAVILLAILRINTFILTYLDFIGIVIPPLAAPWIAEYYILKNDFSKMSLDTISYDVNWIAILSWMVGAGLSYIAPEQFIPPLVSIVAALLSYLLFCMLLNDTSLYPNTLSS